MSHRSPQDSSRLVHRPFRAARAHCRSSPLRWILFAVVVTGWWGTHGHAQDRPADLVLIGGRLTTLDDSSRVATALAVRGDRIVAVGDDGDIRRFVGPATRVMELHGRLVIPGFIEGHGHFLSLGESKQKLDLTRTKSWEEVVALVAATARNTPAGTWIIGRGWHQSKWQQPPTPNIEGYPHHEQLSRAVPDHPVLLTHASGHLCLANAKAMELAGVDRRTADPPGGQLLRDADGQPIGVFRETASNLIERAYQRNRANRTAPQRQREQDEALRLATDECLARGVTTFCDAGSSLATIGYFRRLAEGGQLRVRLWVMIRESPAVLAARLGDYRILGAGGYHLTVRAIKEFMDGALGTHGAWLLEPYADLPGSTGLAVTPTNTLRDVARLAVEHDFQLCVHAIGDRANREVLDVFAAVFREHPEKTDLRWRIEHAQHLSPQDIPRFAPLGVIAAMQGIHATSDAPFVVERLGPRRAEEGAYIWQSLLKAGAVIANGTDTPVESVDPIRCFYASVTRKLPEGRTFYPQQCMTRRQALRSYTLDAAYAAFEENLKGSLTPGKLADVVVLSKDIMSVPDEEILRAQVVCTIVGGKVVFER